jgi:hypothetical protein
MTMAFAAAGIGQTYLERIMGLGYLETQHKIQVHFLMVLGTGCCSPSVSGFSSTTSSSWRPGVAGHLRPGRPSRLSHRVEAMQPQRLATLSRTLPDGLRHPDGGEPFYLPVGNEIAVFGSATGGGWRSCSRGPTGCGKTRFVEHMAWRLKRPLVTVACHDDLSASDLTGRWLIRAAKPSGRMVPSRARRDLGRSATSTKW